MSWTAGVIREVLPNGLTLLLKPDPDTRALALVTHVRAGYFDEPDEWVGISHVLEHMFFKGTRRRGPGELARQTQLLGGYLNASTSYEKTVYYAILPARPGTLERALELQADALINCALDPEELAREIEVVIQESKRKLDSPPAVAAETLFAQIFGVHRIRRWRMGTEEQLRRLDREAVEAYYRTRYTPDRTILGMAGQFDPERAVQLAAALYGEWRPQPGEVPPGPREPEERPPGRIAVLQGDVQRPLAAVGWRSVDLLHPDAVPLDLFAPVLGSGRGSRLWRILRQPGVASSVSASHYATAEVGVFGISLEADDEKLDQAVLRSLQVCRQAVESLETEELERARALLVKQWAAQFETAEGCATALCEFEALGGFRLADEFYHRLCATECDEVADAAARYLDGNSVCAVVYLRRNGRSTLVDPWPPSVPAAAGAELLPAARTEIALWPATLAGSKRARAGGVIQLSTGGIDLLALPVRHRGLASLGLFLTGVRERETVVNAGISALTVRATLRGAGGLRGDELAVAAERLGGVISATVGVETVGWSVTVRSESLAQAAQLLQRIARAPHLEEPDIAVEREVQAEAALRLKDDMFAYPVQQVLRRALEGDPYGLPTLGDPEVVRGISGDQVRSWWEELASARAVAVAVGDLEEEALLDALGPLADWPEAGHQGAAARPLPWRPGSEVETRDKAQTALAIAFPACSSRSPERFVLEVLSAILSGLAGRLFKALRDTRGLAYSVTSTPWMAPRGGALVSYVATSPEREGEAREVMLRELFRVATEPVEAAELERARNYAAGVVEIARQRTSSLVSDLLDAWLNGLLDQWDREPDSLRAVSSDELLGLASRILHPESLAEYVVRGKRG